MLSSSTLPYARVCCRASTAVVPQAKHSTGQPALHRAANQVRADQSATAQASIQSWREPARRQAFYTALLLSLLFPFSVLMGLIHLQDFIIVYIEIWVEVFTYTTLNAQPGKVLCKIIIRIFMHPIQTDCRVRGNIWNNKVSPAN